jgi:hypothetical protein
MIDRQISAEHTRFGELTAQLKRDHDNTLAGLRTQLQALNRLFAVADWQGNVRATLKLAIAVTAAVDGSADPADGPGIEQEPGPLETQIT